MRLVLIDYERAWLAMKEAVVAKKSHGQRDLLKAMTEIELDSRLPETAGEEQKKATTEAPSESAGMPDQTPPLTEGEGYGSEDSPEPYAVRG